MKYKVIINTPTRMFLINGKLSRTPLTAIIDENQLNFIKTKISAEGLLDFSITPYVPEVKKVPVPEEIVEKKIVTPRSRQKDVVDPSSTIGKILNEETIE